jgi:hypothetical protein
VQLVRDEFIYSDFREKIQTMPARHTQRDARAESKVKSLAHTICIRILTFVKTRLKWRRVWTRVLKMSCWYALLQVMTARI